MMSSLTVPPGPPEPLPTVGDLRRLALKNALIASLLAAWEAGYYASFEQCLVVLAVELARANERIYSDDLRVYLNAPRDQPRSTRHE